MSEPPQTMRTVLRAGRLVTTDDVIDNAVITIEAGRIAAIGRGALEDHGHDVRGAFVMAGFVDQHCHGGGGGDFLSTDVTAIRQAAATHLAHGSTTVIASLVSATTPVLCEQLSRLRPLVTDGTLAGVHLEGPWLSPHQSGAHDRSALRAPQPAEIELLLSVAGEQIRMVTLAPELPQAVPAIQRLTEAGIVVAVGHTAADLATTRAAIEAGATVATHLFNCMPPLHKRTPGPVLGLMDDPRVVCELIVDGVHVHPEVVRFVVEHCGPDRVAAVTDAMAGAGLGSGCFTLGHQEVIVADGQARLRADHRLAGSVLTMDQALRNLVFEVGQSLPAASRMLSATPAAAMGLTDRGVLEVGKRADLVVLGDDLRVEAVMCDGRWVRH